MLTAATLPVPCRTLPALLALAVVALACPGAVSAEAEAAAAPAPQVREQAVDPSLEGLPISSIRIVRHDLFDTDEPKTSAWPYRWANALNIITREGFIRRQLLFDVGDRYDQSTIDETARLLRGLDFLQPVEITGERSDDGVAVLVETRDQWTLQVGGDIAIFGDRAESGVSFIDPNFLGYGREVRLEYTSDDERSGWKYGYFDPLFLNSRVQVRLLHEGLSDGDRNLVRVQRPFFALDTRYTWGGEWETNDFEDHLYSLSESIVEGETDIDRWRVWGGLRLPGGGDLTRRVILGFDHEQTSYGEWVWEDDGRAFLPPEDRDIDGIRLGYEQIADRYLVMSGFRTWTTQEDVALGPNFRVDLVRSDPAFGGDIPRWILDGRWSHTLQRGDWMHVRRAWAGGRLDDGDTANLRYGLELGWAELGAEGWQLRLYAEDGQDLDRDRQLTLGADLGLRGWDPDTFGGTGRAVANVGWRRLVFPNLWDVMALGFGGFFDVGATWDPRFGEGTDGVKANVGVSIQADLAHLGAAEFIRVDVATPVDDFGGDVVVSVSSTALF